MSLKPALLALGLGMGLGIAAPAPLPGLPLIAVASEVAYSVNGQAITNLDIKRRAAFLKIQGRKGGTDAAAEELIDQVLVMQEAAKSGVRVAQGDVDAAYERFAKSNKMTTKQMGQILNQVGVTTQHFKEFIRAQMTGGQVIQLRSRQAGDGGLSRQDIIAKMREQRDNPASSTEYILQQVIFVVPAKEKGKAASRKREAEALRARFQSCETTREFAKGLMDVAVRDLGRMLTEELPAEWKDLIIKAGQSSTTAVKTTERGAEFIAICRARAVSDDRVAELKIRTEALQDDTSPGSKAFIQELRKKAQIIKR